MNKRRRESPSASESRIAEENPKDYTNAIENKKSDQVACPLPGPPLSTPPASAPPPAHAPLSQPCLEPGSMPASTQEVRLYIGGLPYSYSEDAIALLLSPFQPQLVSSIYLKKDSRGRSKGYCFASLKPELAATVINRLNGTSPPTHPSLKLVVRPAQQEKAPRRGSERPGLQSHSNVVPRQYNNLNMIRGYRVFVGRLPFVLTEYDIFHIFEPFGDIVETKLFRDNATGESKGAGFIIFRHEHEAIRAIAELNGSSALNTAGSKYAKPLNVKFAGNKLVYK